MYRQKIPPIRPDLFAADPGGLAVDRLRAARIQGSEPAIGKTLKGNEKGPHNAKKLFLGSAIAAAIKRCELVCNPAVVIRPRFTIHARRLSEGPTRSWLVSCVNSGAQLSGEPASSDYVATIHERNRAEKRSSTRRSASRRRVSTTKTK
jgi:hypothetical protein